MTPWRIIATRADGRVCVVGPSARLIEVLRDGGGISQAMHDPGRGIYRVGLQQWLNDYAGITTAIKEQIARTKLLPLWVARAWEVEKYVRDSSPLKIREGRRAFAEKWTDAKTYGGLSEFEAIMLIWEYTRREGAIPANAMMPEIVHEADLPWRYREAWRRSSNGGPVWVDEAKAQAIDEMRAWSRYEEERHGTQ